MLTFLIIIAFVMDTRLGVIALVIALAILERGQINGT